MKPQIVRILDVVLIGPLIVYAGMARQLPDLARALLFVVGVGTIVYNAQNYLIVQSKGLRC